MSFSRDLVAEAEPYMQAQVKKRFLQGLINGDLPVECFQYWLRVDYPYLHNFVKVCSLGVLKAEDPQDVATMLDHVQGIQAEMRDHEKHAERTGHPIELGLRINPEHSEVEVPLYDPCAPGSRLGVRREELTGVDLDDLESAGAPRRRRGGVRGFGSPL